MPGGRFAGFSWMAAVGSRGGVALRSKLFVCRPDFFLSLTTCVTYVVSTTYTRSHSRLMLISSPFSVSPAAFFLAWLKYKPPNGIKGCGRKGRSRVCPGRQGGGGHAAERLRPGCRGGEPGTFPYRSRSHRPLLDIFIFLRINISNDGRRGAPGRVSAVDREDVTGLRLCFCEP